MDFQIPTPENVKTPNARLNLCRKAAGFILRMFQLHEKRPREVGSPLRLVRLNLQQPAKIAPCSG